MNLKELDRIVNVWLSKQDYLPDSVTVTITIQAQKAKASIEPMVSTANLDSSLAEVFSIKNFLEEGFDKKMAERCRRRIMWEIHNVSDSVSAKKQIMTDEERLGKYTLRDFLRRFPTHQELLEVLNLGRKSVLAVTRLLATRGHIYV